MSESLEAVIHDIHELVVGPVASPPSHRPGAATEILDIRSDGAIAIVDGSVAAVGSTADVTQAYPPENAPVAIEARGQTVIPGFVDPHTHAVFAGDRSDEFAARLRGADYQELLADGGGIHRTVDAVRSATDEHLLSQLRTRLDTMLAHGTTTVEVKSGYGLDTETERRLLEVIAQADANHPIDVIPTFMGAHVVPNEQTAEAYVTDVITDQLPAVADSAVFCDVFCDEGAFDVAQSRRILEAGRDHGLAPKIHADEFANIGASDLAADIEATSADHLLQSSTTDIDTLAAADVTPVVLPGAAFSLGEAYADARMIRERGGTLALGTDFNPNCHSESMAMSVALACAEMDLSPGEALMGATHGGAQALDLTDGTGTLREGAPGDLVILDAPSHVHIPYSFGVNRVNTVLKGGARVHG